MRNQDTPGPIMRFILKVVREMQQEEAQQDRGRRPESLVGDHLPVTVHLEAELQRYGLN